MRKPKQQEPLNQQPRAIQPEIALPPETVRAGMRMTLQKFGDGKRDQQVVQLSLLDIPWEPAEQDMTGLDLSVSEDRAVHALQVLLDRTGYAGNLPSEEVKSEEWKWQGRLPRLAITYSEYFEAYQLQKHGDRYQGREREIALEALEALEQPRIVYYERKRWIGEGRARRTVYDIIRVRKPLISISKGWEGLTEEERERVKAGQDDLPGRTTRLLIEFSPLWMDGIEGFYLLKPVKFHSEIQQLHGSKRMSKAIPLFIEWLLTLNHSPQRIGKELLAEKLRLDYLLRQRHIGKLDKYLTEAFDTAKKAGYLLSWQEEASGMLIFDLNPERCSRLKQEDK